MPSLHNALPSHNRKSPVKVQQNLLRRQLRRASNTEWGRRFGFDELARESELIDAYQARVPLHSYEAIQEDVNRVRAGSSDVFWPGQTRYFAVSSGTVSAGKIIPVTEEMLRINRRFMLEIAISYLFTTGNLRLFTGKHLAVPGNVEQDASYPGTLIGGIMGLQALFAPKIYQLLKALPHAIVADMDWDQKLHAIADRALAMDIRSVAMSPSWAIVLFQLLIDRYNAQHEHKVRTIGEIWPNFQLYISGGVALSSYRALLEQQIGRADLHFVESYGASEGFFSFQNTLEDSAMLLHLNNGIFFEFVRLRDLHTDNPVRYTIRDVKLEERYVPVLTTCSGLWAYVLGDVVRFTQLSPHKIVVAGRTTEILDRYGECVFGEEAQVSVTEACDATHAHLRDYHVTTRPPTAGQVPLMEWLIEFERPPDDMQRFLSVLDMHLINTNRHYAMRREISAFAPPEIVVVPAGTFQKWLRQTRASVDIQTKVPRMSESPETRDGILKEAGEEAQTIPLNDA